MRALWLPGVLRAAGLTVHEVPGWRTRGADSWGPVRGITCHHTAGSRNSSIQGEINVLLNGSSSAPPPIAQLFLARNGHWYVVASGLCYHNRIGWAGPNEGYGNDALLGIEAQHSGGDEPWTAVQYNSYVRGVAALVRHNAPGWSVAISRVAGHKEHQPGSKSDPTFNMNTFRGNVTREIENWENDMTGAEFVAFMREAMKDTTVRREVAGALLEAPLPLHGNTTIGNPNMGTVFYLDHIRENFTANIGIPRVTRALEAFIVAEATDDAARDAAAAELRAALAEVPGETAALLGGSGLPVEQKAEILRSVLGDDAPAVGRLLAGE